LFLWNSQEGLCFDLLVTSKGDPMRAESVGSKLLASLDVLWRGGAFLLVVSAIAFIAYALSGAYELPREAPSSEHFVKMVSPDGQTGDMAREDVANALRQGYQVESAAGASARVAHHNRERRMEFLGTGLACLLAAVAMLGLRRWARWLFRDEGGKPPLRRSGQLTRAELRAHIEAEAASPPLQ
jgi:hypothetical protein